jgi:hypothetical protein
MIFVKLDGTKTEFPYEELWTYAEREFRSRHPELVEREEEPEEDIAIFRLFLPPQA